MATQKRPLPSKEKARRSLDRTIDKVFSEEYVEDAFENFPDPGDIETVAGAQAKSDAAEAAAIAASLQKANNLDDVANATTARTNIGAASLLTYEFRDYFATARAAGAVDGTATDPADGGQIRHVTDTGSNISIVENKLVFSGGDGSYTSTGIIYDAIAKADVQYIDFTFNFPGTTGQIFYVGLLNSATLTAVPLNNLVGLFSSSGNMRIYYNPPVGSYVSLTVANYTANAEWTFRIVMEPAGFSFYIRGGVFGNEFQYITTQTANTGATWYPVMDSFNAAPVLQSIVAVQSDPASTATTASLKIAANLTDVLNRDTSRENLESRLYVKNVLATLFYVAERLPSGKYILWYFIKEPTSGAWLHHTVYIADDVNATNQDELITNDMGWSLYSRPTGFNYAYIGNWHLYHTLVSVEFADETGAVVDPSTNSFYCKKLRMYQVEKLQHPDTGATDQADFNMFMEIAPGQSCYERLRISWINANRVVTWNTGQAVGHTAGTAYLQTRSWAENQTAAGVPIGSGPFAYVGNDINGYVYGSHPYVFKSESSTSVGFGIETTNKIYPRTIVTGTDYAPGSFMVADWTFSVLVDDNFEARI